VREAAREVVARLEGERVAVDATALDAHAPSRRRLAVEGRGALAKALALIDDDDAREDAPPLPVLCQDRLDYRDAIEFNARCLERADAWAWATTGPMGRGFVSPVFLRDAGACLECIVRQFERLSPAPELYRALVEQARAGLEIPPVPCPEHGVEMLARLVAWKTDLLALAEPSAALYRLHVLEVSTLEVTSHATLFDPECPACGGRV
jgi:bacteriocin biosynthesis cyclodehydratase domain-containing protein